MSVNRRKELWVGFVTAILGCLWTLISQMFVTSQSTIIQIVLMVWVILHLPLHVILSVIDPPRYLDPAIFYVGAFVQWFLIGWAGYRIRRKFLAISSIR